MNLDNIDMIRHLMNAKEKANEPHDVNWNAVMITYPDNQLVYLECAHYARDLEEAYQIGTWIKKLAEADMIINFNGMYMTIAENTSFKDFRKEYFQENHIQYSYYVDKMYKQIINDFDVEVDMQYLGKQLLSLYNKIDFENQKVGTKDYISIYNKQTLSSQIIRKYQNTYPDVYFDTKIEDVKKYIKGKEMKHAITK